MQMALIFTLMALFAAMVVLNFYFRIRVLRTYQRLARQNVRFGSAHFFNARRLENEILPLYPDAKADILNFIKYIRFSIRMATVLIVLITLLGAVLMYYR
ncbi:MAG: hypothetical protein KAX50_10255 [Saprospiraceae bacterium]|nr:hypothetical protein [Saprospiraceae bacterium]